MNYYEDQVMQVFHLVNGPKPRPSLRKIAKQTGVPFATVQRWSKCGYKKPQDVGPSGNFHISKQAEQGLVKYMAASNVRKSSKGRRQLGKKLLQFMQTAPRSSSKKRFHRVGKKYWQNVKKRHPIVAEKTPELQDGKREVPSSKAIADCLTQIRTLNDQFHFQAKDVANCDEIGLELNKRSKVFVIKPGYLSKVLGEEDIVNEDSKRPKMLGEQKTRHITVLLTCFADGSIMTPFFVFNKRNGTKKAQRELKEQGFACTVTNSGYIGATEFQQYFKLFQKEVKEKAGEDHTLLVLDGAVPHVDYESAKSAASSNTEMELLPPNKSHVMQPLDVTVNKVFRTRFMRALRDKLEEIDYEVLSMAELATIVSLTLKEIDPKVVIDGFRKSGIWPITHKSRGYNARFTLLKGEHYNWKRYYQRFRGQSIATNLRAHDVPSDAINSSGKRARPGTEEGSNMAQQSREMKAFHDAFFFPPKRDPAKKKAKKSSASVLAGPVTLTTQEALEELKRRQVKRETKKKILTSKAETGNKVALKQKKQPDSTPKSKKRMATEQVEGTRNPKKNKPNSSLLTSEPIPQGSTSKRKSTHGRKLKRKVDAIYAYEQHQH